MRVLALALALAACGGPDTPDADPWRVLLTCPADLDTPTRYNIDGFAYFCVEPEFDPIDVFGFEVGARCAAWLGDYEAPCKCPPRPDFDLAYRCL